MTTTLLTSTMNITTMNMNMNMNMHINMDIDIHNNNDLDLSGYTTTTSSDTLTSDDDHPYSNWNHWSPVVNWDALTVDDHNGFHQIIDSFMDDVTTTTTTATHPSPDDVTTTTSDDVTTTTTTTSSEYKDEAAGAVITTGDVDLKGLRLVHLLTAAAEALTGANKSRELARVILVRLKELVSPTHTSNMERLAAYFTHALQALLDGTSGAHNNNNNNNNNKNNNSYYYYYSSGTHRDDNINHAAEMVGAFQLLQEMSPYVKFGHFTANQAIVEAVAHERRVHIVDYDIMEGIQWASLMQAFASNYDGPLPPHLRITALSRTGTGRRSIATVQETGRRLTAFAASLGQPFSFHQCRSTSLFAYIVTCSI